jgi:nicotinamidase-related amidase
MMARSIRVSLLMAFMLAGMAQARAQTNNPALIDQWAQIKPPPAPILQAVTLDPADTVLLVLDFVPKTCNMERRPRCIASLQPVGGLLDAARAHGVRVIYSNVVGGAPGDVLAPLQPRGGEPMVASGPDKFLHTDLAALLRQDNATTVIVTGTAAEGAVLSTASEAAFRGYRVIVPVDGMSSASLYAEQYVAWDLLHSPGTAGRVTLSAIGMIGF